MIIRIASCRPDTDAPGLAHRGKLARLALMLLCLFASQTVTAAKSFPELPQEELSELDASDDFPEISRSGNSAAPNFLTVEKAFMPEIRIEGDVLQVNWTIADGYYLYRDQFRLDVHGEGLRADPMQFSQNGEIKEDPWFGRKEVFYHSAQLSNQILGQSADNADSFLTLRYQGCADAGLCYPPARLQIPWPYRGVGVPSAADTGDVARATTEADRAQTKSGATTSPDSDSTLPDRNSAGSISAFLQASESLPTILLVFFLLGAGLAFTPCVFPMIPILSGIIAGQHAMNLQRAFVLSVTYVAGMALTYAAAGVLVATLGAGANLQAQMQNPVMLWGFAALFVALAFSMFGFYELQLPAGIRDRIHGLNAASQGGTLIGVFMMGCLSALVVSPCVSAPLAGALLYISSTGDQVLGGSALLALGLGMGAPLIAIGTGGGRWLPRAGAWMGEVKNFFGVSLLAVALFVLERILPPGLILGGWGALLIVYSVYLGAFDTVENAWTGWKKFAKGAGLLLFVIGIALLAGALSGASDPLRPLSGFSTAAADPFPAARSTTSERDGTGLQTVPVATTIRSPAALDEALQAALAAGKPVLLDFYADWCISCKIMERTILRHPEVLPYLAPYEILKVDVTEAAESSRRLLDRYGLFGPPAFVFYDEKGREAPSRRIIGETSREHFLVNLRQTGAGTSK